MLLLLLQLLLSMSFMLTVIRLMMLSE